MDIPIIIEIIIVGLVLSADSFSAAVAMGMRPFSRKDALKFAFASSGAEVFVTSIGALSGSYMVKKFSAFDHWIAFGLLAAVALHMAYEGICDLLNKDKTKPEHINFHSFAKVLIVSFATSLDSLGVGMGLGVANKPLVGYLISIGLWAFIGTIAGLYLAKKLSKKFGPIVTIFGAIVLGIIAFEMLKI